MIFEFTKKIKSQFVFTIKKFSDFPSLALSLRMEDQDIDRSKKDDSPREAAKMLDR